MESDLDSGSGHGRLQGAMTLPCRLQRELKAFIRRDLQPCVCLLVPAPEWSFGEGEKVGQRRQPQGLSAHEGASYSHRQVPVHRKHVGNGSGLLL